MDADVTTLNAAELRQEVIDLREARAVKVVEKEALAVLNAGILAVEKARHDALKVMLAAQQGAGVIYLEAGSAPGTRGVVGGSEQYKAGGDFVNSDFLGAVQKRTPEEDDNPVPWGRPVPGLRLGGGLTDNPCKFVQNIASPICASDELGAEILVGLSGNGGGKQGCSAFGHEWANLATMGTFLHSLVCMLADILDFFPTFKEVGNQTEDGFVVPVSVVMKMFNTANGTLGRFHERRQLITDRVAVAIKSGDEKDRAQDNILYAQLELNQRARVQRAGPDERGRLEASARNLATERAKTAAKLIAQRK
jgi:hypothetical protein